MLSYQYFQYYTFLYRTSLADRGPYISIYTPAKIIAHYNTSDCKTVLRFYYCVLACSVL